MVAHLDIISTLQNQPGEGAALGCCFYLELPSLGGSPVRAAVLLSTDTGGHTHGSVRSAS